MAASESRTAGVRAWKAEEPPKGPGLRVFFFLSAFFPLAIKVGRIRVQGLRSFSVAFGATLWRACFLQFEGV